MVIRRFYLDVLDGLFHIAKADNILHPNELAFLEEVARIFGFSESEFAHISGSPCYQQRRKPLSNFRC